MLFLPRNRISSPCQDMDGIHTAKKQNILILPGFDNPKIQTIVILQIYGLIRYSQDKDFLQTAKIKTIWTLPRY